MSALTHLQRLEAEDIDIMREPVSESERTVMLYWQGQLAVPASRAISATCAAP